MAKTLTRVMDRVIMLVGAKAHAEATPVAGYCYGASCGGYGAWYSYAEPTTPDFKKRPCC